MIAKMNQHAIIVGTSCSKLGWDIANSVIHTHDLINPNIKSFKNGEKFCEFKESVRGKTCFVIQSIAQSNSGSINDNLMELVIMIDALKRASASNIIAIIPFLGYSRQDRRVQQRSPISSRVVASILEATGVNHIMTLDLHSLQGEGFYQIPFDNISTMPLFVEYIKHNFQNDQKIIVSPDIGGVSRARALAVDLDLPLAIIDKRRDPKTNETEVMHIISDETIKNKTCIIIDDMVDTGGTLVHAAEFLKKEKAKKVISCSAHGLFSNNGLDRILSSNAVDQVICTDSVETTYFNDTRFKTISAAKLIANNITRIIEIDNITKQINLNTMGNE